MKKHWLNWLKEASSDDIYTANKYTNDPTDFSNARIPTLLTNSPKGNASTTKNIDKAGALAKTSNSPLPVIPVIPTYVYPEPIKAHGTSSHKGYLQT